MEDDKKKVPNEIQEDAMYKALIARITALENENKELKESVAATKSEIGQVKGVVGGIIEAPIVKQDAKTIKNNDRSKELDEKWHKSLRR